MAFNIIDTVKTQLNGQLMGQMGSLLGDEGSKAQGAADSIIPALLNGISGSASTSKGADALFNAVQDQDDSLLDNIGSLLGGGQASTVVDNGNSVLSALFGSGGLGKLAGALSGFSGLSKGGTSSMMGMLAPVIMGVLKRKVLGDGLNSNSLAGLLGDQSNNISAALPPGLGDQLNSSGFLSSISGSGAGMAAAGLGAAAAGAAGAVGDSLSGAASSTAAGISNVAGAVGDGVSGAAGSLGDSVSGAAGSVKDGVSNAAGSVGDSVSNVAGSVQEGVSNAAGGVGDSVSNVAGSVQEGVSNAAGNVGDSVSNVAGSVQEGVSNVAGSVGDSVSNVAGSVQEGVSNAAGSVGDSVSNAAGSVQEGVSNAAGSVGENVSSAAGGLREGTANEAGAVRDSVSDAAGGVQDGAANAAGAVGDGVEKGSSLLRWLMPLVILLLLAWLALKFLFGGGAEEAADKAADAGAAATSTASEGAAAVSQSTSATVDSAVETATDAASDTAADLATTAAGAAIDPDAVGNKMTSIFSSATETLTGISDTDSATAALPALEELGGEVKGMSSLLSNLPEAARGPVSTIATEGMGKLKPLIDSATSIPGVGSILEPVLGPIMESLQDFGG